MTIDDTMVSGSEHLGDDLIYLASPYSDKKALVRTQRFYEACRATAKLMSRGHVIFSPIVHNHAVNKFGLLEREGWDFWRTHCEAMLAVCSQMAILQLDGWHKSLGIAAETGFAVRHDIPIILISPVELGIYDVKVKGELTTPTPSYKYGVCGHKSTATTGPCIKCGVSLAPALDAAAALSVHKKIGIRKRIAEKRRNRPMTELTRAQAEALIEFLPDVVRDHMLAQKKDVTLADLIVLVQKVAAQCADSVMVPPPSIPDSPNGGMAIGRREAALMICEAYEIPWIEWGEHR